MLSRRSSIPLFITAMAIAACTREVPSSPPVIPKTWDDEAVASFQVPLADASVSPKHISSDYYYRMPVRPIYKSYPVYHPSSEPAGYFSGLEHREPEILWDETHRPPLKTEADWIKAGELVFDAPISYDTNTARLRDLDWYRKVEPKLAGDGSLPASRYFIREKGKVELGTLGCADCHTRVLPDGTVVKGAQSNTLDGRAAAYDFRSSPTTATNDLRALGRALFAAPWLKADDPVALWDRMSLEEMAAAADLVPAGLIARHGTSPLWPVQVPDLIGVQDRHYLDHTGLVRHRDIGDLMRYAAVNQDADALARYGNFRPTAAFAPPGQPTDPDSMPDPAMGGRYSDEQLYALAKYLYSLKPPKNPNPFDIRAKRGEEIFTQQGCPACHTPPLYTNNTLTPADGFEIPDDHRTKYAITDRPVGTDPKLALKTRRATGYYKVPSLKGVWYRGPLSHDGSVATVEDWFDPNRLRSDYLPVETFLSE